MSDDRYERSADMRLLELRRVSLGIPQRILASTSYSDPDSLTDGSVDLVEDYVQSGTILVATIDARPRTALIPGALVTVSLSVSNDGDVAARSVRMSLPLPVETTYRPGTLAIDGAAAGEAVAGELFGVGADLGDVEPGRRRTLVIDLLIEAGTSDIILSPHLSALSGAILGLRAMRLKRNAPSSRGVAVDGPFYESDNLENSLEPLAAPAPKPLISVLQPQEYPPALKDQTSPTFEGLTLLQPPRPDVKDPVLASTIEFDVQATTQALTPVVIAPPPPTAQSSVTPPATEPVNAIEAAPAIVPPPKKSVEPAKTKPNVKAVTKPAAAVVEKSAQPAKTAASGRAVSKSIAKTVTYPVAKPATETKTKPKPPPKAKAKPQAANAKKASSSVDPSTSEAVARPKIEVIRSTDESVSFTGQGGPMLTVRIDRKRLATLTGLFSGASLGMIAHYLVLNALAARDPLPGDGTDASIATFVDNQEQLLSRALIATRLGKTPSPDSIGAALPAFPPALAAHTERRAIETPPPGSATLFRAFQPSEVVFVQRMLSNDNAEPFMRAAQLFVGLCSNDAVVADERERRRVGVALTAYAALATAEISRIFLRGKISGAPALFKATDRAFDDAARTVLTALAGSMA